MSGNYRAKVNILETCKQRLSKVYLQCILQYITASSGQHIYTVAIDHLNRVGKALREDLVGETRSLSSETQHIIMMVLNQHSAGT